MAAPSKKRATGDMCEKKNKILEDEDAESSSGDEDLGIEEYEEASNENDEFMDQEVTVEFEARNLEDSDFHGVKKLLSQLFLKANIDLSELTNVLIAQNYIGSSIKQVELDEEDSDSLNEDDDDSQVFGIISLLNLTEKKNLNCVQQLKTHLLEKCSKCADKAKLASLLNDDTKQIGWIISERFINIPATISVPSFESLWKEIDQANKKHMKYNFTHYVMLSKLCKLVLPSGGHAPQQTPTYINNEEEIFLQSADFVCEYSVKEELGMATQGQWGEEDDDLEPYRAVMVIPQEKITDIMVKMKQAFG